MKWRQNKAVLLLELAEQSEKIKIKLKKNLSNNVFDIIANYRKIHYFL